MRGTITFEMLTQASHEDFWQKFAVARTKTVFSWEKTQTFNAEVVLIDHASNITDSGVFFPCVVWVGWEGPPTQVGIEWAGCLPADYTVAQVIDILDRAAVFLMDWKARKQVIQAITTPADVPMCEQSEHSHTAVPAKQQLGVFLTLDIDKSTAPLHRLKAWIFLDSPYDTLACTRALALMANEYVSVEQLQTHCDIGHREVAELLDELRRRNLLESAAELQGLPEVFAPTSAGFTLTHKGFVRRLTRWLREATGND